MWFFIIFTQLLTLITSMIFLWLIRPKNKKPISKAALILAIFAFNNAMLIYGFTEFWYERFHVYLVVTILQGFMFYAIVITALARLILAKVLKQNPHPKQTRLFAIGTFASIVMLAVFNAYSPALRYMTVTTDKPLDKPVDIALISDTHLGRWFGNRQIKKMVNLIDEQSPDVVVIAGDIMNDTTIAYDNTNMHEQLSQLKAPLGVYATLGNHDYRGYDEKITQAVEAAGITALDSESVLLNDAVWLVGRSDDVDLTRLAADTLLKQVDTDKPVVFLEHRPSMMEEISVLPVDLHLSGHTHGGQIFPLTMLKNWFEPLNYGAKKLGNTQFLVTSGYGFGPVPFRFGTRSEIWMIRLQSTS